MLITDSFAISPLGLATIPAVAVQQINTSTSTVTALSSVVGSNASSIVDLSGLGQLLSAVADSRSRLEVLQAGSDDTSQAGVLASAQGFVGAFNSLQAGSSGLQGLFDSLAGTVLNDQLALSLNEVASVAIAAGAATLASLQDIGIVLETTTASASVVPGFALLLDENALSDAVTNDAAGTAVLLERASQALLSALSGFELQAASAVVSKIDLTVLGSATVPASDLGNVLGLNTSSSAVGADIATDLLSLLSADTVANDVLLSDLDLAAVGLGRATLMSDTAVRTGSLSVDLLNTAAAVNPLNAELTTLTESGVRAIATTEEAAPAIAASVTTGTQAAEVDSTLTTAQQLAALTTTSPALVSTSQASSLSGGVNSDALAAERDLSAASIALQNLLANPALQLIRKHFDPAYSALIAASHQHDFIQPEPLVDARRLSLVDTPAAVLSTERLHALADYSESGSAQLR